ncbi:type II toxin-antitoxin system RelE/ParE family toxin [Jiella pelagia]|uniref:Type II toxin-antitoxin system RelE/ParE family toxin n=1 Tax=Jiella pelagia TaxID=2986949 RepID=A0ABY7C1H5_9HYPH|nr:type II toxin-antitoxin system RelE/ParE family toxin [Jiella pelagia]WAP69714.1 type II toxin-antitoxin system RelE/ParE family toxin [Jiella pelagia]
MDVVVTPSAIADLENLHRYIAGESSEDRADSYIARIQVYLERLAAFPKRGTAHDELLDGLRTVGFERRATIAFVVTDKTVYIQGVFYAGRDWRAQFQPSGS